MRILLTNDDGIDAPGLYHLRKGLENVAEVVVVAPQLPHSGGSHSITVHRPLHARKYYQQGEFYGMAVDGTPADCVKLAVCELLDVPVDLVVSGINHGPNVGINLIYSGTLAAAVEGAIEGLPAIAFSLDHEQGDDFAGAGRWAGELVKQLFTPHMSDDRKLLLNVNIPGNFSKVRGVRVTEQTRSGFREKYHKHVAPGGREFYFVHGDMKIHGDPDTSDAAALKNGYITVTPVDVRFTDHDARNGLSYLRRDF